MDLRACGGLVALLLVVAMAPASATAQAPRAELPTHAVGERWVRSDGVYELIRIEGDRYVFAASADGQIHLMRDVMIAQIQRRTSLFELDPPPKLPWPLEVGKSTSSWGTWRWENNSAGAYTRFVKAVGTNVRSGTWGFPSFQVAALDQQTPLQITLETPAPTESSVVKGHARSASGISELIVIVNGTQVSREDTGGAPKPELAFSVPLTLVEGRTSCW